MLTYPAVASQTVFLVPLLGRLHHPSSRESFWSVLGHVYVQPAAMGKKFANTLVQEATESQLQSFVVGRKFGKRPPSDEADRLPDEFVKSVANPDERMSAWDRLEEHEKKRFWREEIDDVCACAQDVQGGVLLDAQLVEPVLALLS